MYINRNILAMNLFTQHQAEIERNRNISQIKKSISKSNNSFDKIRLRMIKELKKD